MKRRYIYSILFAIPGLVLAAVLTLLFFGVIAGILWLLVFGDNQWPTYIESVLSIAIMLVFLAMWAAFVAGGYMIGKRREADTSLNKAHVLASAGITIAVILLVVLWQISNGNILLGP
jgi:hypothetical protein